MNNNSECMATKNRSVLLLSSSPASHSARSGYQLLADYLPQYSLIRVPRSHPQKPSIYWAISGLLRRISFTKWWVASGVALEWKAILHWWHHPEGVVVSLWADHDLSLLDIVARLWKKTLVGVFHACPDDLESIISNPKRLKAFSRIILMSKCQLPFFVNSGVEAKKIDVLLHGVDTDYFCPTASASRGDKTLRVLSVGGHRRDFRRLAEVCEMASTCSNIQFTIVAPQRFREAFEGMPHVTFVSGLADEQLLELYQSSDCFLQLLEQSTANNTILEAMSCGLPIIANDIGGISEYVPVQCGILLSDATTQRVLESLLTLATDPIRRSRAAEESRIQALQLSWPRVAIEFTFSVINGTNSC
jgi:glycosyltransferase involved in cell wall biosynthesis